MDYKKRENIKAMATGTDNVKNEFVKMLKRTQQQIIEAKNRKQIAIDTYSRDLQQLHKDQDRLIKAIENLD